MGRPSTKPKDLRDGFYIEVRNKNQKSVIKIRRDTKKQLLLAIDEYKVSKEIIVLGKSVKGKMNKIPDLDKEDQAAGIHNKKCLPRILNS